MDRLLVLRKSSSPSKSAAALARRPLRTKKGACSRRLGTSPIASAFARNFLRAVADRIDMRDPVWFDLGEGEGVIELPEGRSGAALELHVVLESDSGCTIAWWENENGTWLTAAVAGSA